MKELERLLDVLHEQYVRREDDILQMSHDPYDIAAARAAVIDHVKSMQAAKTFSESDRPIVDPDLPIHKLGFRL